MTEQEIEKQAILLATQFKNATSKRWFKPIHIKKIATGETESSIKMKLDVLVSMGFAQVKTEYGNPKYCITLSNEDKILHLKEYLIHIDKEREDVLSQIAELEK